MLLSMFWEPNRIGRLGSTTIRFKSLLFSSGFFCLLNFLLDTYLFISKFIQLWFNRLNQLIHELEVSLIQSLILFLKIDLLATVVMVGK